MDGPSAAAARGRPEEHLGPRVVDRRAAHDDVCRCGTRLLSGTNTLALSGLPSSVTSLLRDRTFCSMACVRATFLEMLETLEGLDAHNTEGLVHDLQETYVRLAVAFAQLLDEWYAEWFRIARAGAPGAPSGLPS